MLIESICTRLKLHDVVIVQRAAWHLFLFVYAACAEDTSVSHCCVSIPSNVDSIYNSSDHTERPTF